MTQHSPSSFWIFKPAGSDFSIHFVDVNNLEHKTAITVSSFIQSKAQLTSMLDIQLLESLQERMDLLVAANHVELPDGMKQNEFNVSVVASLKFSQPDIISNDADIDFDWELMRDWDIGDTITLKLDDTTITFFITGLFSKALHGVVLKTDSDRFKLFASLYLVI